MADAENFGNNLGEGDVMVDNNRQEQDDEVMALGSIYWDSRDELEYTKTAEGFYEGHITIRMARLDGPILVKASEGEERKEISISYLSPVKLNFTLTPEYPSNLPPVYSFGALWLNHASKVRLVSRLSESWELNHGTPVLYNWIELLRGEATSDVLAKGVIDLDSLMEERGTHSESGMSAMDLLKQIRSYNDDATVFAFEEGWYDCEVCCTSASGRDCIQFQPCAHTFCLECVSAFFHQKLQDNSLRGMQCLTENCESNASQAQIKRMLTEEEFERYEKLLLDATLDLMTDVITCPRMICQAPVIVEVVTGDDPSCRNLAICTLCDYAFCSVCRKTYHGLDPCDFTEEQREQMIAQYEAATPEEKESLCRRMGGRKQLEKYIAAMKSDRWIKENSKPCPSCRTNIEKKDGCNKIACTKCRCYFCWLCGAHLKQKDPYDHFRMTNSKCFNRLFEGMIVNGVELGPDEFPEFDDDER